MRYFLFFYSWTSCTTEKAGDGIIHIADEAFPSHQSVMKRLFSNFSHDNKYYVTGLFEFKSKEDYDNFLDVEEIGSIDNSKDNHHNELADYLLTSDEQSLMINHHNELAYYLLTSDEQSLMIKVNNDDMFVEGVYYLHKNENSILLFDHTVRRGIFRRKIYKCRKTTVYTNIWYDTEYNKDYVKMFRRFYIPIPFRIMIHLLQSCFRHVDVVRKCCY